MLHAHWVTDSDETCVLGIKIWYSMTSHFLILDKIGAIQLVPWKYQSLGPSPTEESKIV